MTAIPDFTTLFIQIVTGLVVVLGLAFLLLRYVLPRTHWGRQSKNKWFTILDRFPLEPRKHIYLAKVAERYVVLGASDGSVNQIMELTAEEGRKIEESSR